MCVPMVNAIRCTDNGNEHTPTTRHQPAIEIAGIALSNGRRFSPFDTIECMVRECSEPVNVVRLYLIEFIFA